MTKNSLSGNKKIGKMGKLCNYAPVACFYSNFSAILFLTTWVSRKVVLDAPFFLFFC